MNKKKFLNEYYKILSPDGIPNFIYEYTSTLSMQRIGKISMNCGTDYINLYHNKMFYSNLDHSIGVALIAWNFTKDKKQTLAALFHDIATPTFKHCIDFMNNDYEVQESTEELTEKIIMDSKDIMYLLDRDGIDISEVSDYKIYPICDNSTPKLSSDRLEYNFSGGFSLVDIWSLDDIREIYNDIVILKNEDGIIELGFKSKDICEKYIIKVSKLWPEWIINKDKVCMQFWADCVRMLYEQGEIDKNDLYVLSELEVIDRIENSSNVSLASAFKKFRNTKCVYESDFRQEGKYCKGFKVKKRYLNPLVLSGEGAKRIYDVSILARDTIDGYLNYKMLKYGYLDFDFNNF